MERILLFLMGVIGCFLIGSTAGKVSVSIKNLNLTLHNDYFSASFNSSAMATSIVINKENIVSNASGIVGDLGAHYSFYVDYHNGTEIFFAPTALRLLNKTEDFAHVAYIQDCVNALSLEVHYIITSDVRGLYQYVVAKNEAQRTLSLAELRVVCRFNPDLMGYINNGAFQMKVPKYEDLITYKKVQDETWQLPDGSYYTKYDLAGYVRDRNYYGILGGGYGAWLIHPSHEYNSGGPLKQDIIAHQDSLMIVYMTGAHFGTPSLTMPPGFVKFYGPWLIYFNTGNNEEVLEDVQKQTQEEISKWPYGFVHDKLYPISRGIVTGIVKGVKAMVILSPEDEACDQQVRGYSYSNETDKDGRYIIEGVRPGEYKLSVYPLTGASAGTLLNINVSVQAGNTVVAETLTIREPPNIIWQIGETNRRSTEFKYGNESRNYKWQFLPPANLTFEVGKSRSQDDWYYAQTKPGVWSVQFRDTQDNKNRTLLLSLAGASCSSISISNHPRITVSKDKDKECETPVHQKVYLNGNLLQSFTYDSDHAIYRSAMESGVYHFEKLVIPAELVLTGDNTLAVQLVKGSFMYDCLVYYRS